MGFKVWQLALYKKRKKGIKALASKVCTMLFLFSYNPQNYPTVHLVERLVNLVKEEESALLVALTFRGICFVKSFIK